MKPKTKLQIRIMELKPLLPKLTEPQKRYAYITSFKHIGYRTKVNGICCLECGYTYKEEGYMKAKTSICPNCHTKIEIEDCRKKRYNQDRYFSILTTCKEFQVIRHFHIQSYHERGKKVDYGGYEVNQLWMLPTGKFEVVSRVKTNNFYRSESWGNTLEIRHFKNHIHDIYADCIYPRMKLIPEITRNGFKNEFYDLTPLSLFHQILRVPEVETYLKTNQISLLKNYLHTGKSLKNYWHAIKICIRNKYIIQEADTWKDYIDLLEEFKKDTYNAKYVCPLDLHAAHDKLVFKKFDDESNLDTMSSIQMQKLDEKIYIREKQKFFDLEFSNGNIDITVLKDINDFIKEAEQHRHCVYSNKYYRRKESLILSASKEGQKLETIELNLNTYKIIQARGIGNKPTNYHTEIINLLERNIGAIRKINEDKKLKISA